MVKLSNISSILFIFSVILFNILVIVILKSLSAKFNIWIIYGLLLFSVFVLFFSTLRYQSYSLDGFVSSNLLVLSGYCIQRTVDTPDNYNFYQWEFSLFFVRKTKNTDHFYVDIHWAGSDLDCNFYKISPEVFSLTL